VFTDENIPRFAKGLYPLAALLASFPAVDLALRVSPPQLGSLQWRFTVVGLLFGNFGTILIGFGLAGLIAAICGHRSFLRALGYVAMVFAMLAVALVVLFLLDAVQMRQVVNANAKRTVLIAALGALYTAGLGIFAFIAIGRGALSATRRGTAAGAPRRAKAGAPLVVGPQTGATESV